MLADGGEASGSVNRVRRIGDTVRRPAGRWTPAVHALLRHLQSAGFAGAPRVVSGDDPSAETLSFIPGAVATRPWPAVLLAGTGIDAMAAWLHGYHAAVSAFVPPHDARWRDPSAAWQPGLIVRHGDLGPWNTVWDGAGLVGVIDWDLSEPGLPIDDIAQVALEFVPLRAGDHARDCGFVDEPPRLTRLEQLCRRLGYAASAVVAAALALLERERRRTIALAAGGIAPWTIFAARGDAQRIASDRDWLAAWWAER